MSRVLIALCTQINDVNELKFGIVVWVLHHGVHSVYNGDL